MHTSAIDSRSSNSCATARALRDSFRSLERPRSITAVFASSISLATILSHHATTKLPAEIVR
jgi:hypothetical protein